MQFPISIGLHRSFFLALLTLLVHLAAMSVICLPDWPVLWVIAGVGGLLLSLLWNWQRQAPAIVALRLLDDGQIECRRAGASDFSTAQLLPGATAHPWLTLFRVQDEAGRVTILVAPDSAGAEERRRLRLWLRWRADFNQLPSDAL